MGPPADLRLTSPWLDDGDVLLHIGVHKTGSTAIQTALAAVRDTLREQGVIYPGVDVGHNPAARVVQGRARGIGFEGRPPSPRLWKQLVDEVRTSTGRVVVSGETFCTADTKQATSIVNDLGPSRVRAVATLRPLERLLPSTWQQYVKTGYWGPYDEWLADILQGPGHSKKTKSFWKRNDHGALVERWADVVGVHRVAVIVVDTTDRDRIYRDFEELIGLATGTLTPQSEGLVNRSMTAAEIEVFRRFNDGVRGLTDFATFNALARRGAARSLVEGRRPGPDEPSLTSPAWAVEKARSFGRDAVVRIRASGVKVLGDLDGLVPDAPIEDAEPTSPSVVPIEAAELALEGMYRAAVARIERTRAALDPEPADEGEPTVIKRADRRRTARQR